MSEHKTRNLLTNDINEDSVQIHIFAVEPKPDTEFWQNLCIQINSTLKTLSQNYIWHREEFKLYLPILNSDIDGMPMHLSSTVCFGDNIDDEWYIVYLVMELSNNYKDLVIQIVDNDGDFLLIEAANYLPIWANPENTVNRVFIFNNAVHIIPPSLVDLENSIELKDALQIIKHFPEQTEASCDIQKSICARVEQYPQKIEDNFHKAIVNLPLDIAALLTLQSTLIAPIVIAYCNHDIIDAKICRNLQYTDYIPVEVKFTKCLYAMLKHAKIMRFVKSDVTTKSLSKDVLGFKLTCGFQIIMEMLTKDIFNTRDYLKFEKNLKDIGYFKDNIESSLNYNQLLDKAREYFLNVECPTNSSVSKQISELMTTDEFLNCKETLKHQNVHGKDLTEDNDDWLNINPNHLDNLLNNQYGNSLKFDKDDVIAPEAITSKLSDFLKQTSDFEGIETSKIDDTESNCINFNPEQFENCLEKIMDFLSSDVNEINLHDDSDLEYESDLSNDVNDYELDKELIGSLKSLEQSRNHSKTVLSNLSQSIKEEGVSGPSSNLLRSIGIHKTDLLDSDDD